MYKENRAKDIALFAKAVLSNQPARFAPAACTRPTRRTGRGEAPQSPAQMADYFVRCFQDYGRGLDLGKQEFTAFLKNKTVLEYGAGDILGVALLMNANGASKVRCFDRFPLHRASQHNLQVYEHLFASLDDHERARAARALNELGKPDSGVDPSAIGYFVSKDGLCVALYGYDLVVSRAVLKHVGNRPGTVGDVARALKPAGVSVHKVDLRSYGLDRYRAFDFLTRPGLPQRLMFSNRGFPNRWRANTYRALIEGSGLRIRKFQPTARLATEEAALIEPHVSAAPRGAFHDELSWLGFWMVIEPARPARLA